MGTAYFMFEAIAYTSVCGYFYWISKYWYYLMIPCLGMAIVGTAFVAIFLPESPRFLISNNKYDQAR